VVIRLIRLATIATALVVAGGVADARPYTPPDPDGSRVEIIEQPEYKPPPPRRKKARKPAQPPLTESKLGFRIALGPVPVEGRRLMVIGLGLGVEHHLAGQWRILGEYEFVWLSDMNARRDEDLANNGHRFHTGLRRVLVESRIIKGALRFYVDGEVGGGLLAGTMPRTMTTDAAVLPHAFAGIRFGYNFVQKNNKASRVWEPEFLLRAIAVPDGVGLTFGVGMFWD
jgi:hypothetical protein